MEAVQTANPPTFESVWAGLQEVKQILKENAEARKEIDQIVKETDRIVKENAEQLKEWKKENARQVKEYNQRFGEFTNRFGEVVEYMVAPNMQNKFWELGLTFNIVIPDYCVYYPEKVFFLQTDVYLENGDKAMLVEVKTKLSAQDVKDHIKRLEKMRKYADLRGDKRTFLGAVAGVVIKPNVKEYALKQGFYVVEPSGETFNITPPGALREW